MGRGTFQDSKKGGFDSSFSAEKMFASSPFLQEKFHDHDFHFTHDNTLAMNLSKDELILNSSI